MNTHKQEFCVKISQLVQLVMQIRCVYQQKDAWFESDFCVSCASCIATLLTTDKGPFCLQNSVTSP